MGNFADSEMLFCDETLDEMDIDGALDDIEDGINMVLKPQLLMFDGLDDHYEFSNIDEDTWKIIKNSNLKVPNNTNYILDCINDPNIYRITIDQRNNLENQYVINEHNDEDIDNWNTNSLSVPTKNSEGLHQWEEPFSYTIDEYCEHRKEDLMDIAEPDDFMDWADNEDYIPEWYAEHPDVYGCAYSLPERDEMDDLEEKINAMTMEDENSVYFGLTEEDVENLHC